MVLFETSQKNTPLPLRALSFLHVFFSWPQQSIVFFCLFFTSFCGTAYADALTQDVTILGIEEEAFKHVRSQFQDVSLLKASRKEPILSVSNLRGLVKSDVDFLSKILRAEGYYSAHITKRLARRENHFKVEIQVIPGDLYVFGDITYTFETPEPSPDVQTALTQKLPVKTGAPALAVNVVAAEALLKTLLPEKGFPFAGTIKNDIVVDHKKKAMDLHFAINTGAQRHFGAVVFRGLASIKEKHLGKFIQWKSGDVFSQQKVNTLRTLLIQSDLFSHVTIDTVPAGSNAANINISVAEAPHRTLGITGGYSTAEGFGGDISWEHRNIFGRGERVTLTARGSEVEQSFLGQLRLPHFKRLDQTLSFESLVKRETTDAFFAHTFDLRAGIERIISPKTSVHAGVEFEYSDVTDISGDRDFFVTSIPLGFHFDSSDNLLNPGRGFRATITAAPSFSVGETNFAFLKNEIRTSAYFPLFQSQTLTLALRSRLGSIISPKTEALSATKRFFSGGGGSIRGFSYQRVGPLDRENNPTGGRSVTEIAAELRWRFTSSISMVPFIEGGNVYESELPKFNNFRWGAGLGVRYHTDFGPIRLDVAIPFERQEGERSFQLYISLGQAF